MIRRVSGMLVLIAGIAAPVPSLAEPVFDHQRLFTTAAERERLDADRLHAAEADPPESPAIGAVEALTAIHAHGYVRREDGPDTAWIRVREQLEARTDPEIRGGRITVDGPGGRLHRMRPGRRVDGS